MLGLARRLEQRCVPSTFVREEQARIDDREAVVRLGGEVDDDVDRVLAEAFSTSSMSAMSPCTNVIALLVPREVRAVSGVRQEVERDDRVVRMPLEPVVDEVGADEPGRAGDEDPHARILLPALVALAVPKREW